VPQYEAQLGGKVRVPTLDGAEELTIPARTNSGRTFWLKGRGLTRKHGRGDFFGHCGDRAAAGADAEFDELIRQWRNGKPYNPRKDIA
jgi:DnaJ-class molecular chaperone